jgi:hypothetical protein
MVELIYLYNCLTRLLSAVKYFRWNGDLFQSGSKINNKQTSSIN